MATTELIIVGGGLAGSEAAFQVAERGIAVRLYEMRPHCATPAHKTDRLAELVCSNSFRAADLTHAVGLLKEELRRLGSLIMRAAEETRIPAGSALAVDREAFSERITERLLSHPLIEVVREEMAAPPEDRPVIVATGPLTSEGLAKWIQQKTDRERLYFYDAIAPIVDGETIDEGRVFRASRYERGGADYINCPMTRGEYDRFYDALMAAEKVAEEPYEHIPYFEGCMPIEVMAERGRQTLTFGPMKPVGLVDPRSGVRPYAVVQLRQEDRFGSCYNMVGFQTKLKWGEQKRIFRMIPGLEQAEFFRFGSLHRNTFLNAPLFLKETLQLRRQEGLFFAGQLIGVEGYVESTGMGLLAGLNAALLFRGEGLVIPPDTTALGGLVSYITKSDPDYFQPVNVHFGLFPPLKASIRNRELRRQRMVERALEDLTVWIERYKIL
jgi:methylenetetrahydrofolate--tRNA-(uracil-5-)-methyltransferase